MSGLNGVYKYHTYTTYDQRTRPVLSTSRWLFIGLRAIAALARYSYCRTLGPCSSVFRLCCRRSIQCALC